MSRRQVVARRAAGDAISVLGNQIRQARIQRKWTVAALATKIGVSAPTMTAIEKGNPSTAIGHVFNAAVTVGVNLFGAEGHELTRLKMQGRETLALLPQRVRLEDTGLNDVDLDF